MTAFRGASNNAYDVVPLVPSNAAYSFLVAIDGDVYTFALAWCETDADAGWYLDVMTEIGEPIAMGLRLVLGIYIGGRSQHKLFRSGVFVMVDTTNQGVDATFEDLGTRVEMRRYTVDQMLNARGVYEVA